MQLIFFLNQCIYFGTWDICCGIIRKLLYMKFMIIVYVINIKYKNKGPNIYPWVTPHMIFIRGEQPYLNCVNLFSICKVTVKPIIWVNWKYGWVPCILCLGYPVYIWMSTLYFVSWLSRVYMGEYLAFCVLTIPCIYGWVPCILCLGYPVFGSVPCILCLGYPVYIWMSTLYFASWLSRVLPDWS